MGMDQKELIKNSVEILIKAMKRGDKAEAYELMEGINNLFINMASMFYFLQIEEHQKNPCEDGDDCAVYKALILSLRNMVPSINRDVERMLQANLKLAGVKFPGWEPRRKMTEEELQETLNDPDNIIGEFKVGVSKSELGDVLRKMGAVPISLGDLVKTLEAVMGLVDRTAPPVDKSKLN